MDFAGVSLFLSLYFYHVVRIGGENTTANTLEATCSGTPAPDAYLLRSWNFKKIFNGKGQCMPIQLSLEYGFSPGSKLLIEGATLEGNWFSIELKSVLFGDIPLHLSGRPYEEKFIKNSKTNSSSWGVEEFEENWPFYCGKKFTLSIECLKESYKMNVNGIQMREFAHRLPHSIIDALRMNGALVISHVQYAVSSIHPDIFWPNSDNSNATTTQITQNQTNGHDSTASPTDLKGPIFNAFDRDKRPLKFTGIISSYFSNVLNRVMSLFSLTMATFKKKKIRYLCYHWLSKVFVTSEMDNKGLPSCLSVGCRIRRQQDCNK